MTRARLAPADLPPVSSALLPRAGREVDGVAAVRGGGATVGTGDGASGGATVSTRRDDASPPGPDPLQPALVRPRSAGRMGRVHAYIALTKPRIIELLLVTTVPAMILAAGGLPDWVALVVTLVGGSLAAGSANALNCYLDRDIDAMMRRTGHRPLARHEVSPAAAAVFGLILGIISVTLMTVATNALAGLLTLIAIAFYVVGYTWLLKRRTPQNIVWGGAAGCMPVLIGWAAVTGSVAWPAVIMFLVVFFWTPPHFWALAVRYREDYALAGVPMLPVVASPVYVARRIVAYSVLTVAASLALWPVAPTGWVYGVATLGAGLALITEAVRLLRATTADAATAKPMRLFHLSNSYLAFVFVCLAVDTFVR